MSWSTRDIQIDDSEKAKLVKRSNTDGKSTKSHVILWNFSNVEVVMEQNMEWAIWGCLPVDWDLTAKTTAYHEHLHLQMHALQGKDQIDNHFTWANELDGMNSIIPSSCPVASTLYGVKCKSRFSNFSNRSMRETIWMT